MLRASASQCSGSPMAQKRSFFWGRYPGGQGPQRLGFLREGKRELAIPTAKLKEGQWVSMPLPSRVLADAMELDSREEELESLLAAISQPVEIVSPFFPPPRQSLPTNKRERAARRAWRRKGNTMLENIQEKIYRVFTSRRKNPRLGAREDLTTAVERFQAWILHYLWNFTPIPVYQKVVRSRFILKKLSLPPTYEARGSSRKRPHPLTPMSDADKLDFIKEESLESDGLSYLSMNERIARRMFQLNPEYYSKWKKSRTPSSNRYRILKGRATVSMRRDGTTAPRALLVGVSHRRLPAMKAKSSPFSMSVTPPINVENDLKSQMMDIEDSIPTHFADTSHQPSTVLTNYGSSSSDPVTITEGHPIVQGVKDLSLEDSSAANTLGLGVWTAPDNAAINTGMNSQMGTVTDVATNTTMNNNVGTYMGTTNTLTGTGITGTTMEAMTCAPDTTTDAVADTTTDVVADTTTNANVDMEYAMDTNEMITMHTANGESSLQQAQVPETSASASEFTFIDKGKAPAKQIADFTEASASGSESTYVNKGKAPAKQTVDSTNASSSISQLSARKIKPLPARRRKAPIGQGIDHTEFSAPTSSFAGFDKGKSPIRPVDPNIAGPSSESTHIAKGEDTINQNDTSVAESLSDDDDRSDLSSIDSDVGDFDGDLEQLLLAELQKPSSSSSSNSSPSWVTPKNAPTMSMVQNQPIFNSSTPPNGFRPSTPNQQPSFPSSLQHTPTLRPSFPSPMQGTPTQQPSFPSPIQDTPTQRPSFPSPMQGTPTQRLKLSFPRPPQDTSTQPPSSPSRLLNTSQRPSFPSPRPVSTYSQETFEDRFVKLKVSNDAEAKRAEDQRKKDEEERVIQERRTGVVKIPKKHFIQPIDNDTERMILEQVSKGAYETVKIGKMEILTGDLIRCYPSEDKCGKVQWLNDTVIDLYFDLIVKYANNRASEAEREAGHLYGCFTTQFYTALMDKENGLTRVKNWARRRGFNGKKIFNMNRIFIPMNPTGCHWTLMVITPGAPAGQRLNYYDSLGGDKRGSLAHYRNIKNWLNQELGADFDEHYWGFLPRDYSPRQNNSDDCGVFACTSAKCLMLGIDPMAIKPTDMKLQRKRIVGEIINEGFEGKLAPEIEW
ncbi:MAG: hypothetical protein M1834_005255 [Cirrosporium novae-zelandiae]|nr:MAG: hypothetical protein M1834_005255 [Cirrosporium novae-zelandiae]